MKAFLKENVQPIVYWLLIIYLVLHFAPDQSGYYLNSDIQLFKHEYLTPILIWMGIIIWLGLLLTCLLYRKSLKNTLSIFVAAAFMITTFLFLLQDLFLATSLYANRCIKKKGIAKSYVVNYPEGVDQTKSNFIPYDVSAKHVSADTKLVNTLYNARLKQSDTVTLVFYKGLFGIAFQAKPFINN